MIVVVADGCAGNGAENGTSHSRGITVVIIGGGNSGSIDCNDLDGIDFLNLIDLSRVVGVCAVACAVVGAAGKSKSRSERQGNDGNSLLHVVCP